MVNPDTIVKKFGADTLRMYELFLGPHETQVSWNDQGIVGVKRFLDRVWNWANDKLKDSKIEKLKDSEKTDRALNRLIKKITEDIENFRFNTAISAFMEFHNEIKDESVSKEFIKTFLILLYPFAPHISEELNKNLGHKKSLSLEKWPNFDPSKITQQSVEIVVQINGKVKARLSVESGSVQEKIEEMAKQLPVVKAALIETSIKRVVFVKDRLINLVI